jgi:hypothetical protein
MTMTIRDCAEQEHDMADRRRNSADEEHSKCGLAALHAFEEFCHRCPMLENSTIKGGGGLHKRCSL